MLAGLGPNVEDELPGLPGSEFLPCEVGALPAGDVAADDGPLDDIPAGVSTNGICFLRHRLLARFPGRAILSAQAVAG